MMVQLIYSSAATVPFSPEDLRSLLSKARVRNRMYEVSGILLYHSGSFLQVLEGPVANVDMIYQSIGRDKRHSTAKILSRLETRTREFGEWSMGFVDSGNAFSQPTGLVDYHRSLPGLSQASTEARRYLRFFQQGLYR